jgi:hypothetical protein
MDVFILPVFVLSFVYSGLAKVWYLDQGVLPIVHEIHNWIVIFEREQATGPTGNPSGQRKEKKYFSVTQCVPKFTSE